jgi:hypothetical protein
MSSGRNSFHHAVGRQGQRGATLIVALIMLVLMTLVLVSGFSLSTSNLKSVGNMQMREESVAAANRALEVVIGSSFTDAPQAQEIEVDINSDGTNDYTVAVALPVCTRVALASAGGVTQWGVTASLGGAGGGGGATWYTDWDLDATVTDDSSGAKVRVRQGVRVLLDDARRTAVCS